MRLRTRSKRPAQPEALLDDVPELRDAVMSPIVRWTVDQLHALGPATGPGHRSFVPIVRSTSSDNSVGDLTIS